MKNKLLIIKKLIENGLLSEFITRKYKQVSKGAFLLFTALYIFIIFVLPSYFSSALAIYILFYVSGIVFYFVCKNKNSHTKFLDFQLSYMSMFIPLFLSKKSLIEKLLEEKEWSNKHLAMLTETRNKGKYRFTLEEEARQYERLFTEKFDALLS